MVAGVTSGGVFGSLYILSSILRDAARRIELHAKVTELRAEYARRMAELEERGYKFKHGLTDDGGGHHGPAKKAA